MYRTQCVLALAVLCVGLAHSWDVAVSLGNQLIFYTNGTETNTVNFISHYLATLAYDEVHDTILYVDKQSYSDGICGYNLLSMENKCFIRIVGSNIHSIAFDPATETLFFTDTNERSINFISIKPGSNNNVNVLITMDDRTPSDIAVDSCGGYIYWTNTYDDEKKKERIERARFNFSEREVITNIYNDYPVFTMTMDAQTRKIYLLEGQARDIYLISHDLDGLNSKLLLHVHTFLSTSKELTVSNDYLYWMNSSESYKTVWQVPKNVNWGVQPKQICKSDTKRPLGIAVNYKIKDQFQGLQDCEVLSSLIQKITVTNSSLSIEETTETKQTSEYTTVVELFCVNGIKDSETSVCKCTPGYIGERCDVSVCENYCLQGNCSFNDEGLPKCRCNAGYSGERCEVYACHGYCLNNGDCSLNEEDEPVCQCVGNHEGTRCEAVKDVTITFTNTPTNYSAKNNLTLADLLTNWRKPTAKISVTVEV